MSPCVAPEERPEDLADRLTDEEAIALLVGRDFWHAGGLVHGETTVVRLLGLSDGPHGVRKQPEDGDHLGIGNAIPATCFPPAVTLASTWDAELVREVGVALGAEARALGVDVLLGPGVNIKRSPLGGRNFEYFSEDPVLAGELAGALVEGIQSRGVAASLKHYAVNNQETDRMRVSAEVSERALREIYLEAFRRAVTRGRPWTVMTAYNRINGEFASESRWLLQDVLRDEWGFAGAVVSDWGGVTDRVAALEAGVDLAMPGPAEPAASDLREALASGRIGPGLLRRSAARVIALADRTARSGAEEAVDPDAHHRLAYRAAVAGAVLLVNRGRALPLSPDEDIVVIGALAAEPRIQGSGSSQVNPTRSETPLEAIRTLAGRTVDFCEGYALDATPRVELADAAVAAASGRVALLVLGLPARTESEGYDRSDIELPLDQLELVERVAAVATKVVVVLQNGGPVATHPGLDRADAVLETWLGGQAVGSATADLLFGRANPSGRLAETIPLRLQDTPSFTSFPGEASHVVYGEGVYVGYRHFDVVDAAVAFPFGHGLSYTEFDYAEPRVEIVGPRIRVRGAVTNIGETAGAEVVQLYVEPCRTSGMRPVRELKAFTRLSLAPGEHGAYEFELTARDFARWDPAIHEWKVDPGDSAIAVGASSRDLRHRVSVSLPGGEETIDVDPWMTLSEALAHPELGRTIRENASDGTYLPMSAEMERMVGGMPLRVIADFEGMLLDRDQLAELLGGAAGGSPPTSA